MGCFTKKEKVTKPKTEVIEFPDPMAGYRGELAGAAKPGALERLELAGTPYQGPLTAALSEFEEAGLMGLGEYLQSPMGTEGELYTSAEDEILKTLQGEAYDPGSGPYYKAYRNQIMRELEEAKDRLAARASAGDKFFGGGRIATEGEMEESALGQLAVTLGGMAERERERRLGAVPQALELTRYEEAAPVARMATAFQFGQLPRLIEQAEMDAEYQEWIRALSDLGIALDTATGLATYQPRAAVVSTGGYVTDGGQKEWVQDVAAATQMAATIAAMFG